MSIASQFTGLKMDELIGGPLSAAADASTQLANATADFINRVGFNKDGRVRTVPFSYQQRSTNDDGTSNLEDMRVDVPMLAIVPIPNLQIDEVNILFDMEVKQSEKSEEAKDMSGSLSGGMKLGFIRVSVTGSVSAHSSNTRSSDNSAKYHVDVRATNHGIPEGLARVLDMMAVNLSPALVSSTLKDENGQDLSEGAKNRALKLKIIRNEISKLEKKVSAAKDALENNVKQLQITANSQLEIYSGIIRSLLNKTEPKDENYNKYSETLENVKEGWSDLQNMASQYVDMMVKQEQAEDKLSNLFRVEAIDESGNRVDYTEKEKLYSSLVSVQKVAMNSKKTVIRLEKELLDKQTEYSDLISGDN